MFLAVCLFIFAGTTAASQLIVIANTTSAGKAIANLVLNGFGVTVMVLAAMSLIHGS